MQWNSEMSVLSINYLYIMGIYAFIVLFKYVLIDFSDAYDHLSVDMGY